jgi:RNA polymerase sigma-70 factor, ECF subfamily
MSTSMERPDLDDLLDRARDGDGQAFAQIYREVNPRLVRYLEVRAADRAEDVASETWLDVSRALHRFEGDEAGFRAWVFTIARNRLIDSVRRDNRVPLRLVDDAAELERLGAATVEALGDPVLATAEEQESTRRAVALIRTLPPDQAEVLMLRIVAGLEPAEIARLVGKSSGAVRVLAHRGLRRLARTLEVESPAAGSPSAERRTAPSGRQRGLR